MRVLNVLYAVTLRQRRCRREEEMTQFSGHWGHLRSNSVLHDTPDKNTKLLRVYTTSLGDKK